MSFNEDGFPSSRLEIEENTFVVNQDAYDGGNNSKQKEGNNQNSNVVKNTGGINSYDASMVDGAMSIPAPSVKEDLNLKNTSVKIIANSSMKLDDNLPLNEELNNVMGMNVNSSEGEGVLSMVW